MSTPMLEQAVAEVFMNLLGNSGVQKNVNIH